MPVTQKSAVGFVFLPREDYQKEHNKLCSTMDDDFASTCCTVRHNQEIFLEHQQKCINRFDQDLQQAIEHAGDMIRELAKCGCSGFCSYGYVMEKMRRLHIILDDTAPDSLQERMSTFRFKLPESV